MRPFFVLSIQGELMREIKGLVLMIKKPGFLFGSFSNDGSLNKANNTKGFVRIQGARK
jgi:hypothetical protein